MTRIGKAPTRTTEIVAQPQEVTCAILVHIPNQLGYYAQRLEIFKTTLLSMRKHAGVPHTMLVFDNGSCREVADEIDRLQRNGAIDTVIRSRENIGKYWGMRWIFWASPGKIVSYTDDDMLFFPGWLRESIKILETYPNVGCVSAYPFRPQGQVRDKLNTATIKWAQENATLWEDRIIPQDWDRASCESVGREWNQYLKETKDVKEMIVEYNDVKALVQGHHCQFTGYKKALAPLPATKTGKLMGDLLQFDQIMNMRGFLRLNTFQGYAMHIGNIIDPNLFKVIRDMDINVNIGYLMRPPIGSWFVMKSQLLRKIFEYVYEKLYWALSRTV